MADLDMGGTLSDIARESGDSGFRGHEVGNHGVLYVKMVISRISTSKNEEKECAQCAPGNLHCYVEISICTAVV